MLAFVGLNRPFCPEELFPRILSSRIPGGQGTLIRVPSWRHCSLCRSASRPHCRRLAAPRTHSRVCPPSGFLVVLRRLHCSPFRDSTSSPRLPPRLAAQPLPLSSTTLPARTSGSPIPIRHRPQSSHPLPTTERDDTPISFQDLVPHLHRSAPSIVKTRSGSVLSRGFILKAAHFPSDES